MAAAGLEPYTLHSTLTKMPVDWQSYPTVDYECWPILTSPSDFFTDERAARNYRGVIVNSWLWLYLDIAAT